MIIESFKMVLYIAVVLTIGLFYHYKGLDSACWLGFCYLVGYFGGERVNFLLDAFDDWGNRHSVED